MENQTSENSYFGRQENEQLFAILLDGNQPEKESALFELHRRGLTENEIQEGIRSAVPKIGYPREDIAQAEIDRSIRTTREFFKGLIQ